MAMKRSGVGVVFSGGGARGAYEAGVFSELLPHLEDKGQRPTVYVGTSAGAINATAFASMHHLGAKEAAVKAQAMWCAVSSKKVFRLKKRAAFLAVSALRGNSGRATGLLDSSPLEDTLNTVISWDDLHENVRRHDVAVGVIALATSTHRTTVFLEDAHADRCPSDDDHRSIDYVPKVLEPRHVLASAAIPMAFPAVELEGRTCCDWYIDGGVRLNTPLKPALALGVERVVVIATDPRQPGVPSHHRDGRAPTVADGAAQLLWATLADNMVEDLRTLARRNEVAPSDPAHDQIEWLFAGPAEGHDGFLGVLIGEVLGGRRPAGAPRMNIVRKLKRRALGWWLAKDPSRLEVLTHLFFDPDFIALAFERGQQDARQILDGGEPPWMVGCASLEPIPQPSGNGARATVA